MQATTIQRIWALVEPVATQEGLEIVDIELQREGRGTTLRVYLDRQGGDSPVDLDSLARASRQLSPLLDVHDLVPGRYTLEVSSPGINRRLRLPGHFRRYIGQRVRVRAAVPIEGRRTFVGTLEAVDERGVTVCGTDRKDIVPFSLIAQANYEHDFGARFPAPAGGPRRHHATGTESRH